MYFDAKMKKYKEKLLNADDIKKKEIYLKKLKYYGGAQEESRDLIEQKKPKEMVVFNAAEEPKLQKPTVSDGEYRLNVNQVPIKAIGYGTLHRNMLLSRMEFERRGPREDDIVIKIEYCGVCHSDWHVILDEWQNSKYPVLVGHEITGTVVKIGSKVSSFKIGDKVALGPNYNSCKHCSQCNSGFEQYCENDVTETYNMPDRKPRELKPTGPITYGGYSNVIVVNQGYVLKIPKDAPMDKMAPVLCAGATMYTPLKYLNIGSSHVVGIAGIGGLGHIGIKLAKGKGAIVVALTRTPWKVEDSKRLGADQAILTTNQDSLKPFEGKFDLIIDTIPFNHDLNPYLNLIKPNGTLWIVGSFFSMVADFNIINRKGKIIRGSSTAGIQYTQETIDFCANNKIYPEIETINIENVEKTHRSLLLSEVKYRYVIDMESLN